MTRIAIAILFLLACTTTYSQNWAPFDFDESHHFRSDTGTWIDRTIHVDSATGAPGAQVWHFPRLLKIVNPTMARGNVPHFCQRTMALQGSGRYHFRDPGSISLDTWAEPGAVALVDSMGTATGIVSRVYAGTVLGQPDSLKVIGLTAGDSLVLSKAHGLVEWPASLGPERYTLVGLQAQHLGDTLPGFDGFYPYQVGDVYCWRAFGSDRDYTVPTWWEAETWWVDWSVFVREVVRDSAGLQLVAKVVVERSDDRQWTSMDTFSIPDACSGLHRAGPGEAVEVGPRLTTAFFPSRYAIEKPISADLHHSNFGLYAAVRYHESGDTMHLGWQSTGNSPFWAAESGGSGGDSLWLMTSMEEDLDWVEGLGFVSSDSRGPYATHVQTWEIQLQGYRTADTTVGFVCTESVPAWPPGNGAAAILWPAVTSEGFWFNANHPGAYTAVCVDVLGRIVKEVSTEGPLARIETEDLRAGIYFVGERNAPRQRFLKVVVVH